MADDHALVEHDLAQRLAQVGIFADPLGNNVPCALQGFIHRGNAEVNIYKACCETLQRLATGFLATTGRAANGSKPFSRAIVAFVRRLGR